MKKRRDSFEERYAEEVRLHLEMSAARNASDGMAPDEAKRQAAIRFGSRGWWSEAARDQHRSRLLSDLSRDLRYGVSLLRRQPGFAATTAVTIGLSVAAAVTVFSFVKALFWAPLPVANADRMVQVASIATDGSLRSLGYPAYRLVARSARSFEAVAAHYSTAPLYLTANGESAEVQGAVVSADYFPLLGLSPRLGRFFSAADDSVPDRDAVAVLGYELWRSRFGARNVAGETVTINGRGFTIVGVAPEGFHGVEPQTSANELWIPAMMLGVGYRYCDGLKADCPIVDILGRLRPGVRLEAARAEIDAMRSSLAEINGWTDPVPGLAVRPIVGIRDAERGGFAALSRLLAAIAAVLLVISCTNVCGLLLARGLTRERELALRVSLGASRSRIVRQLLTESALLGGLGAVLAVGLSQVAVAGLMRFFSVDAEGYAHNFEVGLDPGSLLFAVGVATLATLLFGTLPAVVASRPRLTERLARGGGGAGRRGIRARSLLMGLQVALSFALTVGAALLARSAARLGTPEALRPEGVVLMRVWPRLVGYDAARAASYFTAVSRELAGRPDVVSMTMVPSGLVWESPGSARVTRPGQAAGEATPAGLRVARQETTPDFLTTLGIPLLDGRGFSAADTAGTPAVVLVTASLARRLWPVGSAVGQVLVVDSVTTQVVGVVADYRVRSAEEPPIAMVLVPFLQNPAGHRGARLAVRVRGQSAEAALPALRAAVAEVDPAVPVTEVLSMTRQVGAVFTPVRVGRAVLLSAAVLGLLLCGIGLHGVVSFLVNGRTQEIGVRLAIGARPRQIVTEFTRQGMVPVAWGILVGFGATLAGSRLLGAWLIGISPLDLWAFGIGSAVLLAVSIAATVLPACRAGRVDPTTVLRAE